MRRIGILFFFLILTFFNSQIYSQQSLDIDKLIVSNIPLRNIGPAFMSGRISDIAIHPKNQNIWYIATGSSGVWKTENSGVSWSSIFDKQKSFSIGCITIDINNPHTIWVGTGENVGGRHVGFGDGIYKSTNDGETWENMGLEKSEHISKIVVSPVNSNIIYVAAQGPLWSSGGERGFYKSTDGGKTWKRTLGDNQWTGVTDIAIDPTNPKVIYAATWQRHRTVAGYMGGGAKSGIYRSDDAGENWKKLTVGLPAGKLGKIGIAVSPQNPDVVYAAIELIRRKGAFYKSTNNGESWSKQSDIISGGTGPHYYQEIYADPFTFDKIYFADVRMQITEDGGKTFKRMNENYKHSDNHALAFKKNDPNYLLVGTDGGLYETFDLSKNWRYFNNLPITQFYKIAVDDSFPFYWIYGGTQDNSTQGGPSRTDRLNGITNSDWEVVLFADGYQPATEPGNPDIMYAEWQEGSLMRIDRSTGEMVFIQPQPADGEPFERYNWDAPILVSPHSKTTLYFASQRVWKSEDRGDSWTSISKDLTQYTERLNLPIMGKKQSWDSPWDVYAMSTFNTITSLSESPIKKGLIYVGTDDGLIQITENDGKNWKKIPVENLPDCPKGAFVNDIKADLFNENTVYVCLDNHKTGDLKPYLYKSTNKGKSWKSISSNINEKNIIWRLVQDFKEPNLLFIGTEFGLFFTVDAGNNWIKFNTKANISFRDLAIQKRENDLIAGSFGRGIFIFDDYSFLRSINKNELKKEAKLFEPRKSWWFIPRKTLGFSEKGSQGETYFSAPNPPFGTVFTYYLNSDLKTSKQKRQQHEKNLEKNNKDIEFPGWNILDKEKNEDKPKVFLLIMDYKKNVVKQIETSSKKGFHRITWDMNFNSPAPLKLDGKNHYRRTFMAAPGNYKAVLCKQINGKVSVLTDTVDFTLEQLYKGSLNGSNLEDVVAFWKKINEIQSKLSVFTMNLKTLKQKSVAMEKALVLSNNSNFDLTQRVFNFKKQVQDLEIELYGSPSKSEIMEKDKPSIFGRMEVIILSVSNSTYGPTLSSIDNYNILEKQFNALLLKYLKLNDEILPKLEIELKKVGAPNIEK